MIKLARLLLLSLLVVCVPAQAALAVIAGPQTGTGQCHDGFGGHGKPGPHCAACCISLAVASPPWLLSPSMGHDAVNAAPGLPPFGDLPDGFDRPPRSL